MSSTSMPESVLHVTHVDQQPAKAPRKESTRALQRFRRSKMAILGLVILVLVHLAGSVGPLFSPHSFQTTNAANILQAPSSKYPLGTDEVGRDVLTRLLYGIRMSLIISWAAVALSATLGTVLGAVAGYFGGISDAVIMRFTDALLAIPLFFVLLLALSIFGTSVPAMVLVIGLTSWMPVARVVRSEVLRVKGLPYVEAAIVIGADDPRILRLHVLPQAWSSVIVATTLGVANAILTESALSYLGLGVQVPQASLGNLLRNAQDYLWNAPALAMYPGFVILLVVLAYNWFGDGLRDALDPRMSRG